MSVNALELPLFDNVPPLVEAVQPEPQPESDADQPEKSARDFVKWCLSFGAEFRNSPDEINLRAWAKKTRLKFKAGEEAEILAASRRMFNGRVELQMREATPTG